MPLPDLLALHGEQ